MVYAYCMYVCCMYVCCIYVVCMPHLCCIYLTSHTEAAVSHNLAVIAVLININNERYCVTHIVSIDTSSHSSLIPTVCYRVT